jgi:hypothetical protein
MQPIVARPRPIPVFANLSSADLPSADRVFAGLAFADLVSAGLILAARFIVSPAFARLRFVGPISGSHVSKDYSRKSRFDKSSKHFFRENFHHPGRPEGRGMQASHIGTTSTVFPVSSWTAAGRHVPENRTQDTPTPSASQFVFADQPERHVTPDPARSDAVDPGFQYVRQAPSRQEAAATVIMAA